MNKTIIRIADQQGKYSDATYLATYLKRVVLMRTASKAGDIETISNTILGRLRDSGIKFEIIQSTQHN